MKARISHIRFHVPEGVLSNEELAAAIPEWPAEKILEKTGIARRHIASASECASDLGVAAAQRLFGDEVCRRQDIDFLIFCTQSPDYPLPATSCVMQERLGLRRDVGAFDFNQGCSGFVYGLSLAKGLIETGQAARVLLITAETYTKYVNPRDRSVRTIFGDGAAATLIEGVDSDAPHLGPFVFGTDGKGKGQLIVPAGGARLPRSAETAIESEAEGGNRRSLDNLYMNGAEVFNFTLRVVPEMVNGLLAKAGLAPDDVDLWVFHQASRLMLDRLRAKMKIPEDRFAICLEEYGNTVSSTIPIALEQERLAGRLAPGTTAVLVGFGVGLSWAATTARF
jgi:3-oxoacyl-[acyl-carrier-protein] synthase-3